MPKAKKTEEKQPQEPHFHVPIDATLPDEPRQIEKVTEPEQKPIDELLPRLQVAFDSAVNNAKVTGSSTMMVAGEACEWFVTVKRVE